MVHRYIMYSCLCDVNRAWCNASARVFIDLIGTTQSLAAVQKLAWSGTHGPPGASTTLQHHSADPHGGYPSPRVRRQLIWFHDHKCHGFWSRFTGERQTFSQLPSKNCKEELHAGLQGQPALPISHLCLYLQPGEVCCHVLVVFEVLG
jgi:hypothetical protein